MNQYELNGVSITKNQLIVIDALICTHRELIATDEIDYTIHGMAKGGKVLKIKTGEYWYSYKILANGAITESYKSDNNTSFHPLTFFTL